MLSLSDHSDIAGEQLRAIIFYLTTVGYIDGDLHVQEKAFIRDHVKKLIAHRVHASRLGSNQGQRATIIEQHTAHFLKIADEIEGQVRAILVEAVVGDEGRTAFVHHKLKLRCYEFFRSFDEDGRAALLDTVEELIVADGVRHPSEAAFRDELAALLAAPPAHVEVDVGAIPPTRPKVMAPIELPPRVDDHPFFKPLEQHYAEDAKGRKAQVAADMKLVKQAISLLAKQRQAGQGKLVGKQRISELVGEEPFLDGHVYVVFPERDKEYELVVLGDLHGCYSCLKAALLQSDVLTKIEAHKKNPNKHPDVKLVLLGDYIDRGLYSFNGVLRTLMTLLLWAPNHVILLRGNHEHWVRHLGKVNGVVQPAEAIKSLEEHLPQELFDGYLQLFDSLASVLVFGTTLFAHAGIPRDQTLEAKWKDLASLNDPDIRFQMMWSDPSHADHVPAELQAKNARFSFGRLQLHRFMSMLGVNTMIRGHETVENGFRKVYDDGTVLLLNLFSAGGQFNRDLPVGSSYRIIQPMGLTLRHKNGESVITPWEIEYEMFNQPERNALYKSAPVVGLF
ncbi:MAG: serine/threonine protein phosphatase [Deltaproteobacteria bacterium]|nr:serine/threonine protein phosphatase [Deltaproteobacteria bacterium]